MDNVLSKVVSIIIAAGLMVYIPFEYMNYYEKELAWLYITTDTIEFVDDLRNTGIASEVRYNQYTRRIHNILGKDDIEIQALRKEEFITKDEICEGLYCEGKFYFCVGDIIRVIVRDNDGKIIAIYGGRIKDEAY